MYDFFTHPFWPLLVFGFLVCPRILMLTLWWPLESLSAVIGYPILSYLGFFFAPRLTLAFIFTGFFWQTNEIICVIAFLISFGGESAEKYGFKRIFRGEGKGFHISIGK